MGGECAREKASVQLVRMADEIVEYANQVSTLVADRLAPVILKNAEGAERDVQKKLASAGVPEWPELFDSLRGRIAHIKGCLERIEFNINRAEV